MKTTLNPLLAQLLKEGVAVSLFVNNEGTLVFDLNVMTKSHMHAVENSDGSLRLHMRYNESIDVGDFDSLLYYANYARHGRDFMDDAWTTLLTKTGNWN